MMPSSIVIGAGWAGLNCAYELAKAGHKVTILEAAPQIGGRARSVNFDEYVVDNGQHIALGAYQTMRHIMLELKLDERKYFKILPFKMHTLSQDPLHLRLLPLPAPFNFLGGLLICQGFTWSEKVQIFKFAKHMHKIAYRLPSDCTILELLLSYNQSRRVIEHLWEPIALAAMSTNIAKASAQVFLNVLGLAFNSHTGHSDWYLPSVDLSTLLPHRMADFLHLGGHKIICNQAVQRFELQNDLCVKVYTTNAWQADHVVIALPPWQAIKLLQPHAPLQTLHATLQTINYEPITTVYLHFAAACKLPYPIIGMLQTTAHWIFDRAFAGQPNVMSVIITGLIDPTLQDNAQLYQHVLQEIQQHLPIPVPISYKVIREKRAAFTCDLSTQKSRPNPDTPIKNLWLTGDYVQTGLPATLEGALLSGKQTAREILRSS